MINCYLWKQIKGSYLVVLHKRRKKKKKKKQKKKRKKFRAHEVVNENKISKKEKFMKDLLQKFKILVFLFNSKDLKIEKKVSYTFRI